MIIETPGPLTSMSNHTRKAAAFRRLLGAFVASIIASIYACGPAKAEEICKELFNGRKNNVTGKMCIVVDGARIGELLVKFDRDYLNQRKIIDVTNCTSSFVDVEKWEEVTFKTGVLLMQSRDGKRSEWYILTSGLNAAQRHSWLNYSADSCIFEVRDVIAKNPADVPDKAPESGISGGRKCPVFEVMGPDGCKSFLNATSEPG